MIKIQFKIDLCCKFITNWNHICRERVLSVEGDNACGVAIKKGTKNCFSHKTATESFAHGNLTH